MTCQTLREAIVDLARGVDAGQGTRAAVECHVEHCRACAALLAREHQLSLGLRALAASTSTDGASEAMGLRLREMFAEQQVFAATTASEPRQAPTKIRWTAWAAAAVLAVAAAVATWFAATATPSAPRDAEPPVQASGEKPLVTVPTSARAESPTPDRPGKRANRPRPAPQVRYAVATGFVALPSAVGLPDFESGQIIRMEIPLTSLPTYGIEIVPDAPDRSVEADLLVGQDGQARAIRLVTGAGDGS